ncbi:putative vacuolar protein sorting-associated protein 53-like [Apostichopus japonicus]|uniref:Vacuolar protein sorting-associated protein 53 homolog n=1 Tax=Stichopus japonicus TaxID=307972 RepID=A0A2G8LFF6_STIJA|nr:putative vacuolar protein sorting-associated protein 53-like [Apostichopus japonicus]
MLVGGVDALESLTRRRQYGEVANLLQGVVNVLEHFQKYMSIPQIRQLADKVKKIQSELGTQIIADFEESFSNQGSRPLTNQKELTEACLVVNVLDPKVKKDLLKWFVKLQLQEYLVLFQENQDVAWLDKIDRRFAWVQRAVLGFEEKYGRIFPSDWEVAERICVEFCHVTQDGLSMVMQNRSMEIEVKLLLFAIQRTTNFETLLAKRFKGTTLLPHVEKSQSSEPTPEDKDAQQRDRDPLNPFDVDEDEDETEAVEIKPAAKPRVSPFHRIISQCFEPHLHIYIESQDRVSPVTVLPSSHPIFSSTPQESIGPYPEVHGRFPQRVRPAIQAEEGGAVLPAVRTSLSSTRSVWYSCSQLSTGQPLLSLTASFQKYLREYANRLLSGNLPKSQTPMPTSLNFSTLLKEGLKESSSEVPKFTADEQYRVCSILVTAEYCLDTTQQLEEKLKEKIDSSLQEQISLSGEVDVFHGVISNCIQLLVQDLESACEPAMTAMNKVNWSASRPWVTRVLFHSSFITICSSVSQSARGCRTVAIDTHSLKTVLLDCHPSVPKREESTCQIVMSPADPQSSFVDNYIKLMMDTETSDFQKILDMKGLKRNEQNALLELYRTRAPSQSHGQTNTDTNRPKSKIRVQEQELSRIRRLEKIIKKKL